MYTAAVVLHLAVCFLMVTAVLLQAGKGAEVGAAFGGTSQTIFGGRGPGTFLSKVTIGTATIFMLTSLGLAMLSKQANIASSVIDKPAASGAATPIGVGVDDSLTDTTDATDGADGADATPAADSPPTDDASPSGYASP